MKRGSVSMPPNSAVRLPQHADQHRSERPVLLTVDQQFAVRRGLSVRPMADQLLVRTGETTRKQGVGTPLGNFGAVARYLPALSGMRLS